MATSPPISPKVATPLAHRKRRHSTIERNGSGPTCDGDDIDNLDALTSPANISSYGVERAALNDSSATATVIRKLEDDDEDDEESFEDILDSAELEPYKPGMCSISFESISANQV